MKSVQLRSWQREAFALYEEQLARGKKVSLWEATPGAGKTTAALEVVKHQLGSGRARNALVVVPTSHLRHQWAKAAAQVGIHLDSNFGGSRTQLTSDYKGVVVTYSVLRNEKIFKEIASRSVVILDEVHHAGEGLSWGDSLRSALAHARYILCLSGTPFRSDGNPIPFVYYDKLGLSTPDYSYSYSKAVEDGVCRPTAFFTYGGEVSWAENDMVSTVNFADALDPIASARRLRTALDPEAGWIQPMLYEAHETLKATRKSYPSAGGLIACADQDHARALGRLISSLSGEKATVVLSDDAGASKKIKKFSDGNEMWLVACNMVSEGVDIPRLSVGVYATTIRTKMYFRQFLGRVVRRQPHLKRHQVAYVYLPADPTLRQLAEEIESETKHILRPREEFWRPEEQAERERSEPKEQLWRALGGTNSGLDAVIVNGNQLSLFGGNIQGETLREVVDQEVEIRLQESLTKSEEKSKLCSDIKTLVGLIHRKTGKPHSVIHTTLNRSQSVRSQTHCTEDQLRRRIQLLEQMMAQP